jgi:hypothetical protein
VRFGFHPFVWRTGATRIDAIRCAQNGQGATLQLMTERDSEQFWLEMCAQISQEQPKLTMTKLSSIFVV